MTMASHVRRGLWLCLVAALCSGCNSTSNPDTYAVTGKVTKTGQPVAGATVTFVPQSADGRAASGMTDASGVYKLTTFESGDGALPGSYKVSITKFPAAETSGLTAPAENPSSADIDAIYKAMEAKGEYTSGGKQPVAEAPKNELNDKFANPETSGLTAEVKSDGANNYDFPVD
jgi:hypothetical protein